MVIYNKFMFAEYVEHMKAKPGYISVPAIRYFGSTVSEFSESVVLECEIPISVMNTVIFVESDLEFEDLFDKIIDSSWENKDYGDYQIVQAVRPELIGFDPEKHRFICHKCGGTLAGVKGNKYCGCISGWIRPRQQYAIAHEV